MNGIGFKNKNWKACCGIKFKLKEFSRELKYGWQRFWDGYDAREIFCTCDMFRLRYMDILEKYKKQTFISWWCPEGYEIGTRDSVGNYILTDEQQEIILDIMIHHLKMMDEDYVIKIKYGIDIEADDYLIRIQELKSKDYEMIDSIIKQNKKCFFKLFDMFNFQLWS